MPEIPPGSVVQHRHQTGFISGFTRNNSSPHSTYGYRGRCVFSALLDNGG
jgi:hypothetical protein